MEEIWKDIINYEGLYQVSSCGRVKSMERIITSNYNQIKPEKILSHKCKWYSQVVLCDGLSKKAIKTHRLVAEAFIDNPHKKKCVNHKDGDKANNRVENLEWVTNSENTRHAYANGLMNINRVFK